MLYSRKQLVVPELGSTEFVKIAFSTDSKFMVVQGGAPDWTIVVYSTEKKVLTDLTAFWKDPQTIPYPLSPLSTLHPHQPTNPTSPQRADPRGGDSQAKRAPVQEPCPD